MLNSLTARGKIILSLIVFILISLLCVTAYSFWQKHTNQEEKLKQSTIMSEQQATNINNLQNQLKINKQNAEMLVNAVKQAQTGQLKPVNNFTIVAPSLPQATQQIEDRINSKDATLPPVALENTDRTIIVPNDNKTPQANYDVGVFKVNNYRNWEWSVGFGVQDGSKYIPVGLQRNYLKDKAIEVEIHLDVNSPKSMNGWEIKQVIKTDKLFGLF